MARIQKLPPVLWTYCSIETKKTIVFFYEGEDRKAIEVETPEIAMQLIERAQKKGYAAFAAAPIPCNAGQFGVFAFTTVGVTREMALAKNVNESVNKAYRSVFAERETSRKQKETVQVIAKKTAKPVKSDKDDPVRMIVLVRFPIDDEKDGVDDPHCNKTYAYRTATVHFSGERVCVFAGGRYVNVLVVEHKIVRESEIIVLANSIGYKDLESVYCEYPVDLSRPKPESESEYVPESEEYDDEVFDEGDFILPD